MRRSVVVGVGVVIIRESAADASALWSVHADGPNTFVAAGAPQSGPPPWPWLSRLKEWASLLLYLVSAQVCHVI